MHVAFVCLKLLAALNFFPLAGCLSVSLSPILNECNYLRFLPLPMGGGGGLYFIEPAAHRLNVAEKFHFQGIPSSFTPSQ